MIICLDISEDEEEFLGTCMVRQFVSLCPLHALPWLMGRPILLRMRLFRRQRSLEVADLLPGHGQFGLKCRLLLPLVQCLRNLKDIASRQAGSQKALAGREIFRGVLGHPSVKKESSCWTGGASRCTEAHASAWPVILCATTHFWSVGVASLCAGLCL